MRPKFLATILLLAALVVGMAAFLKSRLASKVPAPAPLAVAVTPPTPPPSPLPLPTPPPVVVPPPATPPPPAPVIAMTDEERQAAIEAEEVKLQEWQGNDDSVSYTNILNDLTHPERDVRFAAMEALKQYGNSNAIPVLKDLAAKTDDLDEAKSLLETAKFLSLPPADLTGVFNHRPQNASGAGASK
jgi:hypothetical protein